MDRFADIFSNKLISSFSTIVVVAAALFIPLWVMPSLSVGWFAAYVVFLAFLIWTLAFHTLFSACTIYSASKIRARDFVVSAAVITFLQMSYLWVDGKDMALFAPLMVANCLIIGLDFFATAAVFKVFRIKFPEVKEGFVNA